ncbi:MAG: polymer-forming cytoskeletal protein [Sandaracinaceae bacterium]|nr:polymer-forming cytoskeletal protein [Sandaracinaceae bacterium]
MSSASKIPRGAVFVGVVRGQGDLRVAGQVHGPIEIDGQLVVEATGRVKGEVRARSVILSGVIEGDVHCLEVLRLEAQGRLWGNAQAERLSAAKGAQIRGRIRTSNERAQIERLRRTAGGTFVAPFSSSGSVVGVTAHGLRLEPLTKGQDAPPIDVQRPSQAQVAKGVNVPQDQPLLGVSPSEAVVKPTPLVAPSDQPPTPFSPSIGRRRAIRRGKEAAP